MESQTDVHNISFGTGQQIFAENILPAIEAARFEVVLVTCFWARSNTRHELQQTLLQLNESATKAGRRVKVHLGFSSSSLVQKLFHFSNPRYYDDAKLRALGLPRQRDLKGLDLDVRSIFYLPFSVWHPKFVIIDREVVILPSCNVSWEDWFEGSLELSGPLVDQFVSFWQRYWSQEQVAGEVPAARCPHPTTSGVRLQLADSSRLLSSRATAVKDVACRFLPSPHSRNPRFRLPWQRHAAPPDTPLNRHLLEAFAKAQESIFIQTPNLTSPPVLEALLDAARRGVSITIVTSERLMIFEQLVTAGTTTGRCVKRLMASHKALIERSSDVEAGRVAPGRLEIMHYRPRRSRQIPGGEPQQTHVKLTIVDDAQVVFGSGNMDRASWYTSQELEVAFFSEALVSQVKNCLRTAMEGRTKIVYDGGHDFS